MSSYEALKMLAFIAGRYQGVVHGDDAHGIVDVEFPDLVQAMSFVAGLDLATEATLRDPVQNLSSPVVLQFPLGVFARRYLPS